MFEKAKLLIKITVSVLLLTLLFLRIDFPHFYNAISEANIYYILIASLLFYLGVYFSTLKLNSFLLFYGASIGKINLFKLYLAGSFLNNFLPSSIGGDGYKIYQLSKEFPDKKKEVVSSMIYERGVGFLLLFFINTALLIYFYEDIAINNPLILAIEISFLLLFFAFFFFRNFLLSILGKVGLKIQIVDKLNRFFEVLFLLNNRKTLLIAFFYSAFFIVLVAFSRWLLFFAFGVSVDFMYVLFATTFVQILSLLPISINSIGISEGATVFIYSIIGVSPEISLAVALTGRISMMIASSVGGFFLAKKG